MKTIKCISLWQPWASLIPLGKKRNETRSWAAPKSLIGQPLAIHAAKKWNRELAEMCYNAPFHEVLYASGLIDSFPSTSNRAFPTSLMPFGAIIAVTVVQKVIPTHQAGALGEIWLRDSLSEQERSFGDYDKGRFAWVFGDVCPLSEPVSYRGEQGLFDVDMSVIEPFLKAK